MELKINIEEIKKHLTDFTNTHEFKDELGKIIKKKTKEYIYYGNNIQLRMDEFIDNNTDFFESIRIKTNEIINKRIGEKLEPIKDNINQIVQEEVKIQLKQKNEPKSRS